MAPLAAVLARAPGLPASTVELTGGGTLIVAGVIRFDGGQWRLGRLDMLLRR